MKKLLLILTLLISGIRLNAQNYTMRLANVYSDDRESWDYIYSSPYDTDLVCVKKVEFDASRVLADSLFYDERGNITKFATWQKIGGEWLYVCYVDYTYNEMNLRTSRTNYNDFHDGYGFELGGIYRYYYDEEGKMTDWSLEYFGIDEYQKGIIEYNKDGLKDTEIIQQYNFGAYHLENNYWTEYEYDENNNVERIKEFVWDDETWEVQIFRLYEYDEFGNCIAAEYKTASGAVQERWIYTYDTSISSENVFYYSNPESRFPQLPKSKNLLKSFEYNNSGGDVVIYYVDYEMIEVVVEANVNIENAGTVTGTTTYNHGEEVTLTAIPNEGYKFVSWTENGEVVSIDQEFTFVVTSNRNLVANFELLAYEVRSSVNIENTGTVTGTSTYNHGEEVTLIATPNEGYKFVSWTENGEVVSTDQEFTFIVTSNRNLVANFELLTYEISITANIENAGTITCASTYNHGEEVTLTATPNEGYKFVSWTENGEVISTDQEFTFVVTSNRNLVANFELLTYEVAVTANIENAGTVTGASIYNHGEEVILSATANEGYKFVSWTENDVIVSTESEYSFVITNNRNLTANFVSTNCKLTVVINPEEAGKVEGVGTYKENAEVKLVATANPGYKFVNWTENDVIVSTESEYSFVITNNRNLTANFVSTNCKLTVVINPEEAGKVEGAGTYKENVEVKLIATANPGYKFVNWTENDVIVSSNMEYSFVITDNTDLVANFVSTENISELTTLFNIYPNPVNDKLYIETEVVVEEVVVYDAFGRQRITDNGQQTSCIDVANLNSGVYFVMIKTNEGVVTKRFVKN